MTRFVLAAALATLLLAGCGDDAGAAPDSAPAPTGVDPGPTATASSATASSADSAPTATASSATASSATASSDDEPSPELASALADAQRIAPRLESYYRGRDYPRDLDGVLASLTKAGVKPSAGNRVAGYRYDAAAVEFVLCVENASGAFATYDTAPMALGDGGEAGGCQKL